MILLIIIWYECNTNNRMVGSYGRVKYSIIISKMITTITDNNNKKKKTEGKIN